MAAKVSTKHVVLTGPPGIGKTTLLCKVCESLKKQGTHVVGFYTEECREKGKRTGFDIVTVDGHRGPLARTGEAFAEPNRRKEYRVGQYVVQLAEFERLALSALNPKNISSKPGTVILIDEVGKMELFSSSFVQIVRKLVLVSNEPTVIATIPVAKGKPLALVEEIRHSPHVEVFEVTRVNRDTLLDEILASLKMKSGG